MQEDHNCYLFQCGDTDTCVFAKHEQYWAGWITRGTDGLNKFSHEDALQNLGSQDKNDQKAAATPTSSSTTVPVSTESTTTLKPGTCNNSYNSSLYHKWLARSPGQEKTVSGKLEKSPLTIQLRIRANDLKRIKAKTVTLHLLVG